VVILLGVLNKKEASSRVGSKAVIIFNAVKKSSSCLERKTQNVKGGEIGDNFRGVSTFYRREVVSKLFGKGGKLKTSTSRGSAVEGWGRRGSSWGAKAGVGGMANGKGSPTRALYRKGVRINPG